MQTFETHTWSSEMADYIGTESCADLQQQTEEEASGGGSGRRYRGDSDRRLAAGRQKKEYPPPISSPWILKRYYTNDGRLIIRQENVGHHEFFKVHRANGRLTLQLVPLNEEILGDDLEEREVDDDDDDVEDCSNLDEDGCDDVEYCDDGTVDGGDYCHEMSEDQTVAVGAETTTTMVVVGGGKCYNYKRVISSPCMFGMPVVAAIRPVHI